MRTSHADQLDQRTEAPLTPRASLAGEDQRVVNFDGTPGEWAPELFALMISDRTRHLSEHPVTAAAVHDAHTVAVTLNEIESDIGECAAIRWFERSAGIDPAKQSVLSAALRRTYPQLGHRAWLLLTRAGGIVMRNRNSLEWEPCMDTIAVQRIAGGGHAVISVAGQVVYQDRVRDPEEIASATVASRVHLYPPVASDDPRPWRAVTASR